MITQAIYSTLISTSPYTCGASDIADYVAEQTALSRNELQKSYYLGMDGKGVINELLNLFQQCTTPNWDSYGAKPISEMSKFNAVKFLYALPFGVSAPNVGAESDGHITFEWYTSPRHILSISVSPDGKLHYAALIGARKAYGTEDFLGDIPENILDLIEEASS